MALVWVTGNSGTGKSTICKLLKDQGRLAFDADWDGYNGWVDRTSGAIVKDPPYPVPAGWLDRFAWRISRTEVEGLAAKMQHKMAFLCGSAENEEAVLDLFDLLVCVVIDNETLQTRLLTRTSNAFGKNPEEMAAALQNNNITESTYRDLGAVIVNGTRPPSEVVDEILDAVAKAP